MEEQSQSPKIKKHKRRQRRKKRRSGGRDYKPVRESVILFSLFLLLGLLMLACFWTILPLAVGYFKETFGL